MASLAAASLVRLALASLAPLAPLVADRTARDLLRSHRRSPGLRFAQSRPRATASPALAIKPQQLAAGEIKHSVGQSAVARDPFLNRRRIEAEQRARCRRVGDVKAEKAGAPGGMKAEHGVFGDADAARRHDAQDQRAGRRALAVDDDLLVGLARRHVARPIIADIAAVIVGDPQCRACAVRTDEADEKDETGDGGRTRATPRYAARARSSRRAANKRHRWI